MSNISKRRKDFSRNRYKMVDDHTEFLQRITKSLYYGKLPSLPCLSLPVTELSAELFSEAQKGKSLKRLHVEDAAELTRNACVAPCSLVLALLYLERLKSANPEYVSRMAPSELFLVSLMVSNKFLQDDGEEDEVFSDEWAASAGITSEALHKLERNFLHAIDWRIFVSERDFESALQWLEHQVALRQSALRGWFTYADFTNVTNTIECLGLIKCLVTVYLALSISYLASVSTLVASSLIVSHSSSAILNSRQPWNTFGLNMNDNKMLHVADNETTQSPPVIDNFGKFEEELQETVSVDTLIKSNSLFNTDPRLLFNANMTSGFGLETQYQYLPCLNKNVLNVFFKKIADLGFFNYLAKLFKEYILINDQFLDRKTLKDAYFTSRHWLSHWKHHDNRYYSMIRQFPGTVSITC